MSTPNEQHLDHSAEIITFPGTTEQPESEAVHATAERLTDDSVSAGGTVLEGEVLDSEGAPAGELVRRGPVIPPALAGKAKQAAATAGQEALRHGLYAVGGAWVLSGRAVGRLMHRDITAAIRQARAAGDYGTVATLEQQKRESSNARWQRILLQLKVAGITAVALPGAVLAISLAVLVFAIGAWMVPGGGDFNSVWTDGWWAFLQDAASVFVWAATWAPAALGLGGLALGYTAWKTGREAETLPQWMGPTEGEARDVVPDEGAILSALRNLGIPALNRAFKEGWVPRWVQGTALDGRGYRTQVELPQGVTVEMIADKKNVLAHNLVRLPVEVWPTEPKNKPGVLDLWVAHQGILHGPVDPWPLLDDGTTDYFKGVPVGIDQRGDVIAGKLMAANYGIAGIMGSGKTSIVVNMLLGAMLDPLVELDVFVMAFNADYDPMEPRLNRLVKGDEDEQIGKAMEALRALRSEVTERGKILSELGGDEVKLTRDIAERDPRMRPRVVVFDECQELFRHEKYGEEAKQLAIKVMSKARKCGITLVFVTPAPSAESLPRDLAKTTSHRVCFAIGDHQANDAILGTGSHKQGITATSLVPGEDVGTAMASGFASRPGLLRAFYVKREKGVDQVTPVVERALALREGQQPADTAAQPTDDGEQLDPLADIATVIGDKARMRTQEVLQRLAELNPHAYRDWTFTALREVLADADAEPYKSGGVMQVSADAVRQAITERHETSDGDETAN
ncbi:FtsK/SpoIIIE domain-containing protein [Saccharopolyspora tripterygii]